MGVVIRPSNASLSRGINNAMIFVGGKMMRFAPTLGSFGEFEWQ
jgi:hypothetical protein